MNKGWDIIIPSGHSLCCLWQVIFYFIKPNQKVILFSSKSEFQTSVSPCRAQVRTVFPGCSLIFIEYSRSYFVWNYPYEWTFFLYENYLKKIRRNMKEVYETIFRTVVFGSLLVLFVACSNYYQPCFIKLSKWIRALGDLLPWDVIVTINGLPEKYSLSFVSLERLYSGRLPSGIQPPLYFVVLLVLGVGMINAGHFHYRWTLSGKRVRCRADGSAEFADFSLITLAVGQLLGFGCAAIVLDFGADPLSPYRRRKSKRRASPSFRKWKFDF